jgi:hypothetical protein
VVNSNNKRIYDEKSDDKGLANLTECCYSLIDFATSKYSLRASMKTNNLSQRGKWKNYISIV